MSQNKIFNTDHLPYPRIMTAGEEEFEVGNEQRSLT